jgi:hypothetical protein
MLPEIDNELFRLQAGKLHLECEGDVARVSLGRRTYGSVSVAEVVKILQALPDAAGTTAVRRAIRRIARQNEARALCRSMTADPSVAGKGASNCGQKKSKILTRQIDQRSDGTPFD